jgi:hypothetical protein
MIVSQNEALAYLNKIKGSRVYLRTKFAAHDDPSLGSLRLAREATIEECDEHGLQLTWPPNGRLYA